jgi:hypothetical protein
LKDHAVRRLLASTIVLASALASGTAAATDVQACLAASEKGQQARAAGKLREARERFLVCGGDGCPAIVRRDCTQWQSDIVNLTPSIVFGAKDKQGRDLFDVTVSMDGEPLVKRLDGKSVLVDPGPHSFSFEAAGHKAVVERALVKEGEKTRVITVTFTDGAGAASSPSDGRDSATPGEVRGHTIPPWIVVGVGVAGMIVGTVVVLTAPTLPSNCNKASAKCTKTPGETDAQLAADQDQAGQSDARPTLGFLIGGIGLGVAAGGLLWHFLEPTGERSSTALRFSPWAAPGAAGFGVGRAF